MVKEESWSRKFKNLAKMCSIDNPLPNFDSPSLTTDDLIRNYFSGSFHVGIGAVCVCLSKDSLSFHCVKGLGSL